MESNPEILAITIDISETIKGIITVHEKDNPNDLSEEFLLKYSLDKSMKAPLVNVIKAHQEKHKKKNSKVDENSFAHKQPLCGSVAERILKSSSGQSSKLAKSNSCPKVNYGHLLYEKGTKMKESIRKTSEKILQEEEELKAKDLTFKPKISRNSISIVRDSSREKIIEKSRDHISELKAKLEEDEMKECYFTPMIHNKSHKLQKNRNIFNHLYEDAVKRKKSLEPKSGSKETFFRIEDRKSEEEKFERLSSSRKKVEEHIEKIKFFEANFDKITGQKLFVPMTGRGPSSTRGEKPVWDELYNSKQAIKEKLEDIRSNEPKEDDKACKSSAEYSEKLYKKFRVNKFESIFKKMDSDQDGKISKACLSLDQIDPKALAIMSPLLEELKTTEAELTIKSFVEKLDQVYSKLSTHDKMALVKYELPLTRENFSFVPTINKNATKLATNASYLGSTVYERTKAATEIRNLKLKKAREIQENEKLSKTLR
jgi:hypothetical protein